MPLEDILRRVELIDNPESVRSPTTVCAVLGGMAPPPLRLSDLRAAYEDIIAASLRTKSACQRKRWRIQRDIAVKTSLRFSAETALWQTSRAATFCCCASIWQDRVLADEIAVDTANKNLGRVGDMFSAVNETKMLGLASVFDKANIPGAKSSQRVTFGPAFVQSHFMADGMFSARRVPGMQTPGYRDD